MKNPYLLLSIIGFIAAGILIAFESIETGNILLYTHPMATIDRMFANSISTVFLIDLLFTVLVFFIWTYIDGKRTDVKNSGIVWIMTLLFGLAGGFPFYLYVKERSTANKNHKP